jgi:hypothetical protein
VIQFAGVSVRRAVDSVVIEEWIEPEEIRMLLPIADALQVPDGDATWFLSTGRDPQLLLPALDQSLAEQPLIFDARVRVSDDLSPAIALLAPGKNKQSGQQQREHETSLAARTAELEVALAAKAAEHDASVTRVQQLSAEVRNLQAERVAVVADYRRVHAANESLVNQLTAEQERARQELGAVKGEMDALYRSRSWRLTAPLRRLFRAIR